MLSEAVDAITMAEQLSALSMPSSSTISLTSTSASTHATPLHGAASVNSTIPSRSSGSHSCSHSASSSSVSLALSLARARAASRFDGAWARRDYCGQPGP